MMTSNIKKYDMLKFIASIYLDYLEDINDFIEFVSHLNYSTIDKLEYASHVVLQDNYSNSE